jgi:hypothetical protein
MTTLELDEGPYADVLERAIRRHGEGAFSVPVEPTCCRALASNRLFVRRYAVGSPGSGMPGDKPGWSYLDHLHLIDAELGRMGVEAGPCANPACVVCHPPACPRCGGIAAGSCELPNTPPPAGEETRGDALSMQTR